MVATGLSTVSDDAVAGGIAAPLAHVPLIVDLDRTLTPADLAAESLLRVARRGLGALIMLLVLLIRGDRARLKAWLARQDPVDPARLPLNEDVVRLIDAARRAGRPVWLASAAHRRNVARAAGAIGGADRLIGSRRGRNSKGAAKLAAIRDAIGDAPFDYVGDSRADRPLWRAARIAYTVGVPTGRADEIRLGSRPPAMGRALLKAIRPHQWAKNALVFVPLVTGGLALAPAAWWQAALAFACLSLLASSVYLVNDLLDIDADRLHARKRDRPLASGALPVPAAILAAPVFVLAGLGGAALLLGTPALAALSVYFALTVAYSFRIKAAMIADVIALACLYTIRLWVGAAAVGVVVSSWLLLFSIFFFLSLGYLKRYIELMSSTRAEHELLSGRGYVRSDAEIVAMSGIAAGMVSLLVIILFAEAMRDSRIYASPGLLWLLVIPLLYWLNRVWMMARRGQVDGDPVAFAIGDPRSIAVGGLMALIVAAAKYAVLPG